jgi:hypothetical protein
MAVGEGKPIAPHMARGREWEAGQNRRY